MTAATSKTPMPPQPLVYESVAPAPVREPGRTTHIPALDGIRGLAILLVLLFHFSITHTQFHGLLGALVRLPGAGWVGVDLFFVLSGFLITSILYDAKRTQGFFRNFYMRRVLRIFPLYYGVLFVAFVLLPLVYSPANGTYHNIAKHQVWLWAYLTNFYQPQAYADWVVYRQYIHMGWEWFTHFWSLAVEEQFYLVWPAVVFLLNRRALMGVCGLLMLAALGIRLGRVMHGADPQLTYYYTFCRMDALAAGAVLALASRGARGVHGLVKPMSWVGMIAGLGLLGLFVHGGLSFAYRDQWVSTFGYTLLACFFGAVLVWAVVAPIRSAAGRFFNLAFLRFLGKYSYGVYVLHGLMGPWLKNQEHVFSAERLGLLLHSEVLGAAAHFLLGAGLSLAAAILSWHLYEKHFLKLKRFFEYRAPTLTEPVNDAVAPPGPASPPASASSTSPAPAGATLTEAAGV